jgi:hypothetical protein
MSCTQINVMGDQLDIQSPDRFESRTRRNDMGKFVEGETLGLSGSRSIGVPKKSRFLFESFPRRRGHAVPGTFTLLSSS